MATYRVEVDHIIARARSKFGREKLWLRVDDAYLVEELVQIPFNAGSQVSEASLIVEETSTGKQVFNDHGPQPNEPVSVERLPAGTYRTSIEVAGRRVISDVFLVSR